MPYADGIDSGRDPCAVLADGLVGVLERFVDSYERQTNSGGRQNGREHMTRDENGHFAGRDPEAVVGALDELARRTARIDPDGIGISPERIRKVLAGRYRTIELRTADALASAAENPLAFHDGTLTILPNPRVPGSVRASCCGGSLNGSLVV